MPKTSLIGAAMLMASSLGAPGAHAAERGFSVTEFDHVDVVGPMTVTVTSGKGPSARATGPVAALDRVSVEVRGRRLVVRPLRNVWGGSPQDANAPVSIAVTTHDVKDVRASGTGHVVIDRMRGATLTVASGGSASISIGRIEGDRVALVQDGSGALTVAGKALMASLSNKGTGSIVADALTVSDLTLVSASAGPTLVTAQRSAKVTALGHGRVTVLGTPSCTVTAPGAAEVNCGTPRR